MRILIIEDEKRLADTLADMIGESGYCTDIAYDGLEGWTLQKQQSMTPLFWMSCFPGSADWMS